MGNYHSRIMNIQTSGKEKQSSSEWSYKTGHRDARHAAAEIALEAEREIEELKETVASLEENLACMENYCDDLQSQLV